MNPLLQIEIDNSFVTIAEYILKKSGKAATTKEVLSLLSTLSSRGMQKELAAMQKAVRVIKGVDK